MSFLVPFCTSIPSGQPSRTHYQVLDISPDERDSKAIEEAALRCSSQVRAYQLTCEAGDRFLDSVIPAQQATVNTLQNQTNLLNQLDDLQDQALILNAMIQNATVLVPVQQQLGDIQVANMLQSIIAADQAAVQALQPQIAAVEVETSTSTE